MRRENEWEGNRRRNGMTNKKSARDGKIWIRVGEMKEVRRMDEEGAEGYSGGRS